MDRFRTSAFYDIYKFLANFFSLDQVENVRVAPIRLELLDESCQVYNSDQKPTKIFLLDQEGNCLVRVEYEERVTPAGYRWWNPATWDLPWREQRISRAYNRGETVGQAMARLSNPESVYYVLSVSSYSDSARSSLTLYTPPTGFSMQSWIDRKRNEAAEIVRQEVARATSPI